PVIITAEGSFHGRTLATATLTGQPKYSAPFAPLPPAIRYVPYNDIGALKKAVTPDVGAILLETVQGEGGVVPATHEYLTSAYALAKAKGIIFALDEVQTGVGRTGKMFSYEHFGIIPDIITLAKGLAGGVPIGAVLARGAVAEAFKPGDHGSTFGGNPLACAAAAVVLKRLKRTALLDEVDKKGAYLLNRLTELRALDCVSDVRGLGLLAGLQLKPSVLGAEIVGKMLEMGYIINCCAKNTLRFAPPFIITTAEIDAMTDTLSALLKTYE
ncbi:MAG: aminotransferase class III-fold pyridoxal phosphate-dependent enzyme, partial [Clostridiales bacterium]|nr:aminotransferase class III-fold pyridoxal phosphate-dependent enzyme [Clostridiales bacterium]